MCFSAEYKLVSPTGMEVTLLEAGASVTRIMMADREGNLANIALPLKGLDDPSCAGATLAPYAGRIAEGKLRIDGTTIDLSQNEGRNQLHGGYHSLVHQLWRCKGFMDEENYQEIRFCAEAADGLDGFPGNRKFEAAYRLYIDQRLEITLTAETDKPTRVNLSNHAYFNLTGNFSTPVHNHLLTIQAEEVYLNRDDFLPAGRGTVIPALDFRRERPIGPPHGHAQIEGAKGLNHCYVLSARTGEPAAVLTDPISGRRMRLYTDQPCLTVYSGGFLENPNCALALEAQEHPESPFAPTPHTLYPGEIYRRKILYCFDVIDKVRRAT